MIMPSAYWNILSNKEQKVVSDILSDMRKANAHVCFLDTQSIPVSGIDCSGYYDASARVIHIALRKDKTVWLPTLVHEYCHFLQDQENSPKWKNLSVGGVSYDQIIDLWLTKKIELTPLQAYQYCKGLRELEEDCERRAIEMLKKYNLIGYDLDHYIQCANAYILSYNLIAVNRKFVKKIYGIPDIMNLPSVFLDDYDTDMYDEIIFKCFKEDT